MPTIPPFAPSPSRRVVFLAFQDVQMLDIAGPLQALATANEEGARPPYELTVTAMGSGTVRTSSGLSIVAEGEVLPDKGLDTLFLPGGTGVHLARKDENLVARTRALAASARRVCAVCTGGFLAAQAGLLDNRKAVTHWRSCRQLADEFPKVCVDPNPIYLRDGHVWTSAGVTAGIDLTLALIEEDHGQALAARTARRLVVYLRRPGGQAQFSEPLSMQTWSASPYAKLLESVAMNPGGEWNVEKMAEEACQSPRTLHRMFRRVTGRTPAQAVEDIRFEAARVLLETTDISLKVLAARCGFGSEEAMRRVFQRRVGVSPSEMRQRFGGRKLPSAG